MTDLLSRRTILQTAAVGAIAINPALRAAVYAAGSDAPEKKEVKIGFIPLTDCASVVMASVLGIDQKYGVKIIPSKEASWAGIRDKLVNGELDFAHALYGLIYGVHLGISGPKKDMAVLMTLNQNGQAISLSKKLADKGAVDGAGLAKLMASDKRAPGQEFTFAQTFPTGTHAMWLYYWMAAHGINPLQAAKVITVAPPQMVANMCGWAIWTATASVNPGTTAPSLTASASLPPPRKTSGKTTPRRCWAPPPSSSKSTPTPRAR